MGIPPRGAHCTPGGKAGVTTLMKKKSLPQEQSGYRCGIYIYRGLYDWIWAETNKKHPRPRNPELPRDLFDWHRFYGAFLDSLPLLTEEQELELLIRWQQTGT